MPLATHTAAAPSPTHRCFPSYGSLLPRPIHDPSTVLLAFLEQHLALPLLDIRSIHIATWLNAKTTALSTSRQPSHRGHIDVLSGVELESRLGAVHFEMDLGVGVERRDQLLERLLASVNWHLVGGFVDDEAVVDIWLLGPEGEWLATFDLAEGCWSAGGDASVIDG